MSVLRYKCLILDIYLQDTLYLREQGYEDPWLFFEAKRGPRAKMFGKKTALMQRTVTEVLLYTRLLNVAQTVKITRSASRHTHSNKKFIELKVISNVNGTKGCPVP